MSHKGKMHRGEKWYGHRDVEGRLPIEIENDPNKMVDVEYFLKNKPKEEPTPTTPTKTKSKKEN